VALVLAMKRVAQGMTRVRAVIRSRYFPVSLCIMFGDASSAIESHTRSPAILFLDRWLFVSIPVRGRNDVDAFPASLGCIDILGASRSGGRRDEEEVVHDGEFAN
jgi:hypothetical protein